MGGFTQKQGSDLVDDADERDLEVGPVKTPDFMCGKENFALKVGNPLESDFLAADAGELREFGEFGMKRLRREFGDIEERDYCHGVSVVVSRKPFVGIDSKLSNLFPQSTKSKNLYLWLY